MRVMETHLTVNPDKRIVRSALRLVYLIFYNLGHDFHSL